MNARPVKSTGILSDLEFFFIHRPAISTLVKFSSEADRREYNDRILQRLEIDVTEYAILNIHRIGIEAPILHVFEEMLKWDGDSTCWPNHVAEVERAEDRLEHIGIFLFGRRKYPFGLKGGFFGLKFIPLFNLTLVKNQEIPDSSDIAAAIMGAVLFSSRASSNTLDPMPALSISEFRGINTQPPDPLSSLLILRPGRLHVRLSPCRGSGLQLISARYIHLRFPIQNL